MYEKMCDDAMVAEMVNKQKPQSDFRYKKMYRDLYQMRKLSPEDLV